MAESTGKDGTGIVPVADEPAGPPEAYGDDRLLRLPGAPAATTTTPRRRRWTPWRPPGTRCCASDLADLADLGAEMYRAEVAVAMAGSVLGIHPFDQPDVQLAKDARHPGHGGRSRWRAHPRRGRRRHGRARRPRWPTSWRQARPGDYLAVQAFVAPTPQAEAALQGLRLGGAATACTSPPPWASARASCTPPASCTREGPTPACSCRWWTNAEPDLPVPGTGYTFGRLVTAQADGDYRALAGRGRRVLRVDLGSRGQAGLRVLAEAPLP